MGCLGNSKTEDQRNEEKAQREANKKIEKQLQKDKQIYRATHRLLLLGKFSFPFRLTFLLLLLFCTFLCLLLSRQINTEMWRPCFPPCITFWGVVLGNIVNSVTLLLHKAKKCSTVLVFQRGASKLKVDSCTSTTTRRVPEDGMVQWHGVSKFGWVLLGVIAA